MRNENRDYHVTTNFFFVSPSHLPFWSEFVISDGRWKTLSPIRFLFHYTGTALPALRLKMSVSSWSFLGVLIELRISEVVNQIHGTVPSALVKLFRYSWYDALKSDNFATNSLFIKTVSSWVGTPIQRWLKREIGVVVVSSTPDLYSTTGRSYTPCTRFHNKLNSLELVCSMKPFPHNKFFLYFTRSWGISYAMGMCTV